MCRRGCAFIFAVLYYYHCCCVPGPAAAAAAAATTRTTNPRPAPPPNPPTTTTTGWRMVLAAGAASLFGPATPVKDAAEEKKQLLRTKRAGRKGKRPLFVAPGNDEAGAGEEGGDGHTQTVKASKRKWAEPWSPEKLNGWLQNKASLKGGVEGAGGKGKHKIARCCGLDCALRFCKPDDEAGDDGYYGGGGGDDDDDDDDGAMATTAGSAGAVAGQHNWEYLRAEQDRFAKLTREPDRKAFVIAQVPPKKLAKGSMIAANTVVCNTAFRRFFGVSETLISSCKNTPKAQASSSVHRYEFFIVLLNGDHHVCIVCTRKGASRSPLRSLVGCMAMESVCGLGFILNKRGEDNIHRYSLSIYVAYILSVLIV